MKYGELEKILKARNKKAAAEGLPFEDLFSEYPTESGLSFSSILDSFPPVFAPACVFPYGAYIVA